MNLVQCCFCFLFWFFGPEACGILGPWWGTKISLPVLEGEDVTTALPSKFQRSCLEGFLFFPFYPPLWGFPGGACSKEPACQCRRCKIPGLGRSPGGGPGNPAQYSCLEKPIDRGAWQATVHGVAQSRTWMKRLSTHPALWSQHWTDSKVKWLCERSSLQGCRKVHLGMLNDLDVSPVYK